MKRRFRNAKWHAGITMHKIRFYGGIAGTIFAIRCIHQHAPHEIESIGAQLR